MILAGWIAMEGGREAGNDSRLYDCGHEYEPQSNLTKQVSSDADSAAL